MNDPSPAIVVGVDGSVASRAAASWAVAEAQNRGVPLRLVTVVRDATQRCRAEEALRLARGAVENRALPVSFEEVTRYGDALLVLLEESSTATMICVGTSREIGTPLGVTATTLVERAHCDVAVIRPEGAAGDWVGGVIAVVLDDDPDNDAVVRRAMIEGRLRNATVRQIDRRQNSWVRHFPDVHVEVVAAGTGRCTNRSEDRGLPQLAVVDQSESARGLTATVTPNCHPIRLLSTVPARRLSPPHLITIGLRTTALPSARP
jgi:nucleotide-binding universal stress UspA family protein